MGLGSTLKKAVKSVSKVASPSSLLDTLSGGLNTQGALAIANSTGAFGSALGSSSGLLGNLVNGAVGLGSDYLQSQVNLSAQKDLARYNAEQQNALNEAAYQRNLQQWNMENAYNSPEQQMARFQAAGLNPNLIYSQQNTAASSPSLEPAKFDTGHYNPVDTRMQRAQLAMAMMEHKQLIENQAIQNDLARQKLVLAERAADRDDLMTDAQIKALNANLGLTNEEHSFNRSYKLDSLALERYKADLMEWNSRVLDYRARNKYMPIDEAQKKAGRRPMLMDYY